MSEAEPQAGQDTAPSETVTEADFDSTIAQTLTDERATSDPLPSAASCTAVSPSRTVCVTVTTGAGNASRR